MIIRILEINKISYNLKEINENLNLIIFILKRKKFIPINITIKFTNILNII